MENHIKLKKDRPEGRSAALFVVSRVFQWMGFTIVLNPCGKLLMPCKVPVNTMVSGKPEEAAAQLCKSGIKVKQIGEILDVRFHPGFL